MEVAKELLKKLKKIYRTKKGIIVIGDKAYDTKDIFNFVVLNLRGAAIIPGNAIERRFEPKIPLFEPPVSQRTNIQPISNLKFPYFAGIMYIYLNIMQK